MRVDIMSDTHGHLSDSLLAEIAGADALVHAGDMCSLQDYDVLSHIAPLYMAKGNNDFCYDYGPSVKNLMHFFLSGLRWQVCHFRERLDLVTADIAVCGHTHVPFITHDEKTNTLVLNPGSTTFPRSPEGATMARIYCSDGHIESAEIIHLTS